MPSMISFMRAPSMPMGATKGSERARHRVRGVARHEVRDLRAPPRELGARHAHVARLVGHVVHLAAEGVEGRDGPALLAAAGRGSCSRSSSRWRPPSAGSTRRGSSRRPGRTGAGLQKRRFPQDARPVGRLQARGDGGRRRRRTASILSRMRRPPAQMARISSPMRPGRRVPRGAPERIMARARWHWKRTRSCQGPSTRPSAICASRDAEAHEVLLRQVDAPLAPVHGDVLPVVDELQARADGVGVAQVGRVVLAEEGEQQAPDGIGRAPAVVHELVEGGVALLRHVLAEGVEQVVEEARSAGRGRRSRRAGARTRGRPGRSRRAMRSRLRA